MLGKAFSEVVEGQITQLSVSKPVQSGKLVRVVGLTLEAKGVVAPLGAFWKLKAVGNRIILARKSLVFTEIPHFFDALW